MNNNNNNNNNNNILKVLLYLKAKFLGSNIKYSFFLPFVLNLLGKDISPEAEPIIKYTFSMFILSLVALSCFINIFGYILGLHLLKKYDIGNKYPKLNKLLKYYEKYSLLLIIIEGIICLLILIFLVILNLYLFGGLTFK